jgi:hypothetical protein
MAPDNNPKIKADFIDPLITDLNKQIADVDAKLARDLHGKTVLERVAEFEHIDLDPDGQPGAIANELREFNTSKMYEYTETDIINIVKTVSKKIDNDTNYQNFVRRLERMEALKQLRQRLETSDPENVDYARNMQAFRKEFNDDKTTRALQDEKYSASRLWSQKAAFNKILAAKLKQYDLAYPTLESVHSEPTLALINEQLKRVETKILEQMIAGGQIKKEPISSFAGKDITQIIQMHAGEEFMRHRNQYQQLTTLKNKFSKKSGYVAMRELQQFMDGSNEALNAIAKENVSLASSWSEKSAFIEKLKNKVEAFDNEYPQNVEAAQEKKNQQTNVQLEANYIEPFIKDCEEQAAHIKTKLDKLLGTNQFVSGYSQVHKYKSAIESSQVMGDKTEDAKRQLIQYEAINDLLKTLKSKDNNIVKIDKFIIAFKQSQGEIGKQGFNLRKTNKQQFIEKITKRINQYENAKPTINYDIKRKFPNTF